MCRLHHLLRQWLEYASICVREIQLFVRVSCWTCSITQSIGYISFQKGTVLFFRDARSIGRLQCSYHLLPKVEIGKSKMCTTHNTPPSKQPSEGGWRLHCPPHPNPGLVQMLLSRPLPLPPTHLMKRHEGCVMLKLSNGIMTKASDYKRAQLPRENEPHTSYVPPLVHLYGW
jgi:hypothetical protein